MKSHSLSLQSKIISLRFDQKLWKSIEWISEFRVAHSSTTVQLVLLLSPSASIHPAALEEEEEEGEAEEPLTEPQKSVDESEDKREEYDEDDDEEKATVEVIKPVPEPEEEATKMEPTGQNTKKTTGVLSYLFSV